MLRIVRCPFCAWYRIADPSKGAPPFDEDLSLRQLADHMRTVHPLYLERLIGALA